MGVIWGPSEESFHLQLLRCSCFVFVVLGLSGLASFCNFRLYFVFSE
jgi:hypothetical protein